ncbi:MAG: DNA repair protein RecO [Saccharofermentanales bacterium]
MTSIETKAFVMRSFPWKERHRLVHLLTPELGLITALAPAVASLRSKLSGVTQLFSLSELTLSEKQSRYTIKSGSVIESFISISEDLDRLAAASHAAEVFSDVARHDEPERFVFDLWAYTIYEISVSDTPIFVARMGVMRLMEAIGLGPYVDGCVRCRTPLRPPLRLSIDDGGLICDRESENPRFARPIDVLPGTVELLRHVATAPLRRLYRFHVSDEVRQEASMIADRWVESKLEKQYRPLDWVEEIPDWAVIAPKSKEASHGDLSESV